MKQRFLAYITFESALLFHYSVMMCDLFPSASNKFESFDKCRYQNKAHDIPYCLKRCCNIGLTFKI